MAGHTVAGWFEQHKKAAEYALGSSLSQRKLVKELQNRFDYPFSDRTGLAAWKDKEKARKGRPLRPPPQTFFVSKRQVKAMEGAEDIFVTCAVSNSPAELKALRALERAREECGGHIWITPIRYKNPTGQFERERQVLGEWWAPEVQPYLVENEIRPHPMLSIMATRVNATSSNPLPSRINSRTCERSAIFGHPQLAMRTVATPQSKYPKILYTTGAITKPLYSSTLSGEMAEFHHRIGCIKIEIRGDKFWLRELLWDGDRFIDLGRQYTEHGVEDAPRPLALGIADVHVDETDEDIEAHEVVFHKLIPELRPERLVIHDWWDMQSVSPHDRDSALRQALLARFSALEDVSQVPRWLDRWLPERDGIEIVVPFSNHNFFLDRWVDSGRFRAIDHEFFHWLSWRMARKERLTGRRPIAVELAIREYLGIDFPARFLSPDESYMVGDVEWGMHGHLGPDGARGSPTNMAKIGVKHTCFHIHGPVIWQGGWWGGVFQRHGKRFHYKHGPDRWFESHVLQHENHKRQMVHCIGGDYRGR